METGDPFAQRSWVSFISFTSESPRPGSAFSTISVDPPEVSETLRTKLGAEFTFLSDQERTLIERLNIRHEDPYVNVEIALPTAILVDKLGIVRWIHATQYGNTRMTPNELFEAIERMTLEEQNRELRRARAVSQVVRQVFLMETSGDLAQAIHVMREELQKLGLVFSLCSITIFDEGADSLKIYRGASDARDGAAVKERSVSPVSPARDVPILQDLVAAWREKRVFCENVDISDIRSVLSVPFSHGTVVLGGAEPDQFKEDDIRTLEEFAKAISVGYKRFLDFQELDRRHRELQETQLQLIQSEKMASLGQLVAGVAHELNTPMGAINSNAQTAATALERIRKALDDGRLSEETNRRRFGEIVANLEDLNAVNRDACLRMIRIVDSLRSFARLDEAEWKRADLKEGLENTLSILQHDIGHRIKVVKNYGDLPDVPCYPSQLNQAFMSLLVNATQAIDGDGEVRVETSRNADHAVIKIQDDGRGISEEQLGRIFDPGFTTRGVGVGTGLGLAIYYRIIENHRGTPNVVSEVGKGSTFTIEIPLRAEAPQPSQTKVAHSHSTGAKTRNF